MWLRVFQPLVASSRGYDLPKLRGDALAGLTVAVVAVPQSMAYALIAGVPVEYGLYSVIIQCFIGSLFNSQPFLSVGPMITQSLLVASTVTRLVGPTDPVGTYLQLVVGVTLLKGLMQLAMAGLRLGAVVRYVSQAVVVGFTAGAGVLIAAGQLHWFLGFAAPGAKDDWPGVLGEAQRTLRHLAETDWRAVAIGAGCLALLLASRRISKLIPGPLLAVMAAGVAVVLGGWTDGSLPLIKELPPVREVWNLPHIPVLELHTLEKLLPAALALSLLGLMEVYAIGRTLSAKSGHHISANQELFSQGLTNAVSSFFHCIPSSGSFSRSALNYLAGAQTCYAGVFNAVFCALIFLLFGTWAKLVPMCALAAILFVVAFSLIDFDYMRRVLRSNRADAAVCFTTFAATLTMPLAYAVFIGIFLNLALYLRRASTLHLAEMVPTGAGPFIERPLQERGSGRRRVMFLQIEGDLFFGIADDLRQRLDNLHADPVRVVIFRLKRTHSIDSTVMQVLEQFTRDLQARGGHVILCGLKPELLDVLRAYGLVDLIGAENVFETGFGIFTSAQRALDRARHLLQGSIDDDDLPEKHETDGWSYEI